ncbi:iron chaperone [Geodermatophilus sp. CPCC 206100]|uniref:iron chaperone n=1 Tax=Geodermatophilus sp. CPCC 206100 TaxID=3020054 RepID=UPI003B0006B8
MTAAATTVDEYLAGLPEDVRARVQALREAVRDAVPGIGERISYGMPTFDLDGQPLVHVAAWKRHIALYPLPREVADPDLEAAVAPYRGAKDAMHLPHRQPLPVSVVTRVVLELVRRRGT